MEKKDKMTWYDVTYKQFKQLEPILALDNDMDRLAKVIENSWNLDELPAPYFMCEYLLCAQKIVYGDDCLLFLLLNKGIQHKKHCLLCIFNGDSDVGIFSIFLLDNSSFLG